MKVSYFTMPLHPLERNYAQTLKEDREAIILADKLGFAEAFVGEHVTDRAETITNSMLFLSSLVTETKNIVLGTGTTNLTHVHPALVAAHAAMLDNLLEGRFMLGISPGALATDAEVLGILDEDRNAMFAEAIDHIINIWTTDPPYDLTGRYWNITTARTQDPELGTGAIMKPFQKPHPPILGTVVAPFSKGVIAMGKRGFLPISANFLHPNWVPSHWENYAAGAAQAGRKATPDEWRVARTVFVADDDKIARRYGKEDSNSPYRFYYHQIYTKLARGNRHGAFKSRADQPDHEVTLDSVVDDLVIAGGVNSVVDQILAFRETVGDFGTLLYAGMDWVDPKLAKRSMELMATEVIPAINEAIGSTLAAE